MNGHDEARWESPVKLSNFYQTSHKKPRTTLESILTARPLLLYLVGHLGREGGRKSELTSILEDIFKPARLASCCSAVSSADPDPAAMPDPLAATTPPRKGKAENECGTIRRTEQTQERNKMREKISDQRCAIIVWRPAATIRYNTCLRISVVGTRLEGEI